VRTVISLTTLRTRYVELGRPLPRALEEELRADPRAGAKAILEAVEKRRHANRSEGQRVRKMLAFEQALWAAGVTRVAGIDEAGMSPLAGPVCAGAVILRPGTRILDVDDSKKLDAKERERLALEIKASAAAWAVGWASVEEIDTLNIYWAGLLAMKRAVEGLTLAPEHLLIDARRLKDLDIPQQGIPKGDARSLSIAAASILAKTSRDARMKELDARYPGYGFGRHKGYPVKEHFVALARFGACPVHRRSFEPVRVALGLPPLRPEMLPDVLHLTEIAPPGSSDSRR
jgi:ribonuclease HII